jgi:hypothetical protein
MSTRVRKGKYAEAAGYALEALEALAEGRESVESGKQAREWAQAALAQMLAEGYIEPKDEVQP